MIFEFALACCDEPEPHRKKEGDIIACKPFPWNWGRVELKEYLIVIVDGMTDDEAARLAGESMSGFKRRFKIPFDIIQDGWYPDMYLDYIRDKSKVYQPVKDGFFRYGIYIDATEKVALCYDKFKCSYKYKNRRIA
jgi:hypothetical protein